MGPYGVKVAQTADATSRVSAEQVPQHVFDHQFLRFDTCGILSIVFKKILDELTC